MPIDTTHFSPSQIDAMPEAEFRTYLAATISAEQAAIDAQTAAGAVFVRSGLAKIHTLACANSGHFWSRHDAYEFLCPNPRDMQEQLARGGGPMMPTLLTHQQVAASTLKYSRCRLCSPEVPEWRDRRRHPRDRSELVEMLMEQVEKYNGRPQSAVLAALELHRPSVDGRCEVDGVMQPCRTTQAILAAYNIAEA
jgi:hypothetical protein